MVSTGLADLHARLQAGAQQAGLAGFGVCRVEPFADTRTEMERRLTSGEAGRARFTYRDPHAATDIRQTYQWAERLVVGSVGYLPAAGDPGPPVSNTGRIARFATADHYAPLRSALVHLAGLLRSAGHRAEVLVDDNRLVDRAAAVRAGVAWWGKSTMALAPRFGPWLLLGSIVTDAPLPVADPMVRDCGTCTACIPACPTGALDTEGVLDATKCISYWAQTPGPIPPEVRSAWGDRFYGCDDCLDACPPGQRLAAGSSTPAGRVDLVDILETSDEALLEEFGHFYIPRRDPHYLRRNAVIALGHSGDSRAVPAVVDQLHSDAAFVRTQAAWALGRIGGPMARAALSDALRHESDPEALAEIERALYESEGS
ncbi:MAG: tRNA epoxyqueuosine(34) reductase QueG [Acidimicrobiia bacterium]|nr:tRNA epoxyqueuosine(34) reductase QueG [Acidimicrobiia bacterium]MBT8215464.1 tRNA epoxyqueuosine(34) reductase QueG [Acidimicrobiia bacterium]NNF11262.1 tRNA epoxyqueuosine(34) reductase QueG [Acidimicrobiia bacterium]NNL68997.1 tRNA epoxyqueuosine(34) reductase QueG [Acidimicrobiia bacterium]